MCVIKPKTRVYVYVWYDKLSGLDQLQQQLFWVRSCGVIYKIIQPLNLKHFCHHWFMVSKCIAALRAN